MKRTMSLEANAQYQLAHVNAVASTFSSINAGYQAQQ